MRCSTRRLDRCAWLLPLLLVACTATADAPQLSIITARAQATTLQLALHYQPSPTQLRALDEGVPLTLALRVEGAAITPRVYTLSLRYFPLSRRYQLHVDGSEDVSFALRGYLFAALENLHLPLPAGSCNAVAPCQLSVRQDRAALPGALRLPALLRSAWRVPAARITLRGAGA